MFVGVGESVGVGVFVGVRVGVFVSVGVGVAVVPTPPLWFAIARVCIVYPKCALPQAPLSP